MNSPPAIGLADLCRLARSPLGLTSETAALCGYQRLQPERDATSLPTWPLWSHPDDNDLTAEIPVVVSERPRLPDWRATEFATLAIDPPARAPGEPITDAELAVRSDQPGLPLRPLLRWARMGAGLKQRLSTLVPGRAINVRKLIRQVCSGRPVTTVPRQTYSAWSASAVLLWDDSPEMIPFRRDGQWLYRKLQRERGLHGLKVVDFKGPPELDAISAIPSTVPVLAISAMGQYTGCAWTQRAWRTLGEHFQRQDRTVPVYCPCPRDRWWAELARVWNLIEWDRGSRPPRRGGMAVLPARPPAPERVETLLDALSPATLVEPVLLRTVRLMMGENADVGTEWDAWQHADCWQSSSSFGLWPGPTYAARLERWRWLRSAHSDLTAALLQQHATYSPVIAAEAELRVCFSGTPDPELLSRAQAVLRQVVDRLRLVATEPQGREGEDCGLPEWFTGMVARLAEPMRCAPAVARLLAEGLALAQTWQKAPHAAVPPGIDLDSYREELRTAGLRVHGAHAPREYLLGLTTDHAAGMALVLVPATQQQSSLTPVGRMWVGGGQGVQVSFENQPERNGRWQLDGRSPVEIPLDPRDSLLIESSHARLTLAPITRPPWASACGRDRYGLWADLRVHSESNPADSVIQRLRWIPPGSFRMGSPDTEEGRWSDEGPQHLVTLTEGFWMFDTPCTQALWQAVMGENPSRFNDPQRPVESIDWHQAREFAQRLYTRLQDMKWDIPTEAQWEYACRAGTETATYAGPMKILGDANAPDLDPIAWYGGNSGVDDDLDDGSPLDYLKDKQYAFDKAGTHPVKRKLPNPWGLYDMLGNVWEWCRNGWHKYSDEPVVNPEDSTDDNARRVFRGGGWVDHARYVRAAYRGAYDPGDRGESLGFRCVWVQSPSRTSAAAVPSRDETKPRRDE